MLFVSINIKCKTSFYSGLQSSLPPAGFYPRFHRQIYAKMRCKIIKTFSPVSTFFFIVHSSDSICGNPIFYVQIVKLDIFQASFLSRCHFSAPSCSFNDSPVCVGLQLFLRLQRTKTAGVGLSALEDGPKIGCLLQGWLTVEAPLNYPETVEG